METQIGLVYNNSLKQSVTRVTFFAAKAKPAPRYGSIVPPLYRHHHVSMGDLTACVPIAIGVALPHKKYGRKHATGN